MKKDTTIEKLKALIQDCVDSDTDNIGLIKDDQIDSFLALVIVAAVEKKFKCEINLDNLDFKKANQIDYLVEYFSNFIND